mmetsp:Transcript_15724/g.53363  ORF Transcript_15724/g.53363 Transcript_15724/m.53363 type:complete len:218 (-) Transcript_15724:179-832(-)
MAWYRYTSDAKSLWSFTPRKAMVFSLMLVMMNPGCTAATATPRGPTSARSAFVNVRSAALEVVYMLFPGAYMYAAMLLIITTRPLCLRSVGRKACVMATAPQKLMSNMPLALLMSRSSAMPRKPTPALFTTPMSGLPCSSHTARVRSTAAAMCSALVTSRMMGMRVGMPLATTSSKSLVLRTPAMTVWPMVASVSAACAPMPDDAPVMTTTPRPCTG